ncbi:MAG: 3-oxoacid CoA-transferase [Dehalococcoidia bacterium]
MRPRILNTMAEAVAGIPDGASLMLPGFGGAGTPWNLLTALYHQGAKDLTFIANGAGGTATDPRIKGAGDIIDEERVVRLVASFTAGTHPSRIPKAEQLVRDGKMTAELLPQGTLAERIRAGGAGVPAFFTPAGVGTMLAEKKEHRTFRGREYVLEEALTADYALIRAHKADEVGNLVFRRAARNFNPIMAMAATHTIVEVEEPIVPAGTLNPDEVHLPGVYVEAMVSIASDGVLRVDRAPNRPAAPTPDAAPGERRPLTREQIASVIGRRLQPGWIANLGVGMPTLASSYVDRSLGITLTSENGVIGYAELATEAESDPDVVNAGGQNVTLIPGATFVHHADSFALIRRGLVDVTVLGAYEVAADGSFANWRMSTTPFDELGGIGGAMDLVADAKQIWIAMEHTTRDGSPRLLERCTLPVTSPRGVTTVVTDLAVLAIRDGRFVIEELAPGYTAEEVVALTGGPVEVSPNVRTIAL